MRLIDVDVYQLAEKLKNRKAVCFGAGGELKNFVNKYKQNKLEKRIICVLDNDKEKQKSNISINDYYLKVMSIHDFCADYPKEEFLMLITCTDIVSVYEQLEKYDAFIDTEVCSTRYIMSTTRETDEQHRTYPESFRLSDMPMIPKVIHYCWFGGKPIPEKNLLWMESWKKYCPDYEIVRWDESNYDVSQNKYMYQAYKAGKLGFVPDYARLDIVYKYGGIYLDTDVELISTMDELVYQPAFAGVDGSWRVSLGLGFGAVKGSPIMGELREQYSELTFYDEYGDLNMIAAPALQEKIFMQKGYQKNGEYQIVDGMTIYPEKILSAKCNTTGRILPTSRTVAIHHFDGSWVDEEKRIKIKKIQSLFQKETGDNDGERCRENDSEI